MTDLTLAAARAARRAAQWAEEHGAELTLLYPARPSRGGDRFELAAHHVSSKVDVQRWSKGHISRDTSKVVVRMGDPLETVAAMARESQADLVVLGPDSDRAEPGFRKLAARLPRAAARPTLVVNREPRGPYESILLAVDLTEISSHALRVADSWGLLTRPSVSVVHAFTPPHGGAFFQLGVSKAQIRRYANIWNGSRRRRVLAHIDASDIDSSRIEVLVENVGPARAIRRAVRRMRPDLLVVGTKGRSGLARALLGSVAEEAIRVRACDVLVIPAAVERNKGNTTIL